MAFKARKLSKGMMEVIGLETFIEQKIAGWAKKLGFAGRPVAAPKKAAKKVKAPAQKSTSKSGPSALQHLVAKLDAHPKRALLVKAGKQKDQLLRSLIPLYLGQKLNNVEITSGDTSDFWKVHGVKYLAPNAAKALREHVGYARRTKSGPQITPNGVKYVEAALKGTPLKRAA
ncbi:MAG: hypothetical protein IPJ65_12270 [Archangiaceae bacterium]|nr:hypothetical protein [Archangiaceae bacterium]